MKHCAPIMLRNDIFQKYCLYKTEKNKLMNFYFVYCNLKRFCVFWNLSDLNCISEREIQKILSEELKSIMWFFQKCLKAWQKKHWKMIYYMRKKISTFLRLCFLKKQRIPYYPTYLLLFTNKKNHCCCQYSILYLEKNCYNKQGEDK